MSDTPAPATEKVIYLHGFDKKELFALVDLIKKNVPDPKDIAFATSTKNNMTFTLEQLIFEARKDHALMTKYNQDRKAALAAGLPPPPFPQG
ncbi:MAG: DUF3783 domain-containing protein [Spirochaetales bacterium]